ncbi:MAG: hypothetical protein LBS56_08420 [Propionibacteriaceae bacterium]|nr:hypothetical protein [Propionibacteriaceae bacterium]
MDFKLMEALTSSRLGIGLAQFKALFIASGVLMLAMTGLAAALIGLSVAGSAVEVDSSGAWLLLALWAMLVWVWSITQELVSQRRRTVVQAPNRELFKAWDIEARDVLVVYRFGSLTSLFGLLLACLTVATVVSPPSGPRSVAAAVLAWTSAGAGWLAALAVAARNARIVPAATPRPVIAVLGLASVGWGAAVGGLIRSGAVGGPVESAFPTAALVGASVVGGLAVAAALIGLAWQWRRLAISPWSLTAGRPRHRRRDQSPDSTAGLRSAASSAVPHPARATNTRLSELWAALWAAVRGTWQARTLRTLALALGVVLGAATGARLAGVRPVVLAGDLNLAGLNVGTGEGVVRTSLLYAAVLVAITLFELIVPTVGAGRLWRHLRWLWEAGVSEGRAALALLGLAVVPALATGVAIDAGVVLIVGDLGLSASLVCVAMVGGGLLADAAFPPPGNTDGTSVTSMVTFVSAAALAAPVVAALYFQFPSHRLAAGAGLALILAGAWRCLKKRVLTHPSSSPQSRPDTVIDVSWTTGR